MRLPIIAFILVCAVSTADIRYCPPDYFYDTQHCEKCQQYCTCVAENQCDSCIDGYTKFKDQCIKCPQASGTLYGQCSGCCSRQSGTLLSCTDCVPVADRYSFLFAGRCILSEGCFEVDQNGFCKVCRTGYFPKDNICETCDQSCSTCVDIDNCVTCAAGYYWKVVNGGLCSNCPVGCDECDNDETCNKCLNKYYLYQDHCLTCPDNCQTCVGGSTCTSCQNGILVANLCILCTDTTYGGSTGCLSCKQANNFIQCEECDALYFLNEDTGACSKCSDSITGAARCRDAQTPTQCLDDYDPTLTNRYYLVGISCVKNIKSCKKIADIEGNCSSCYDGYTLQNGACTLCPFTGCTTEGKSVVSNTCQCTKCERGYYESDGNCVQCTLSQCGVCPNNICSACLSGYYFDASICKISSGSNCLESKAGSSTLCQICDVGYYLGSDQLCYNCQTNCLDCKSRKQCVECSANNYLYSGYCFSYPPHCAQVDTSSASLSSSIQCKICQHGYYLENGACLECSVELGTLSICDGLCPIDYYIENLTLTVDNSEILETGMIALCALIAILL